MHQTKFHYNGIKNKKGKGEGVPPADKPLRSPQELRSADLTSLLHPDQRKMAKDWWTVFTNRFTNSRRVCLRTPVALRSCLFTKGVCLRSTCLFMRSVCLPSQN